MDDFVLNVKQIAQYPRVAAARSNWTMLLQAGDVGTPYQSIEVLDFLNTALELGGYMRFAPQVGGIAWNGATLTWNAGVFAFSDAIWAPFMNVGSPVQQVATIPYVDSVAAELSSHSVHSFNFRTGAVQLTDDDIKRAGGAPIRDAHFGGWITAPTFWDPQRNDDTVATTAFVQLALCNLLASGAVVSSYNGRGGAVVPQAADVTAALTQPGVYGYANTPPMGDASGKISTTLFVDNGLEDLRTWTSQLFETKQEAALLNYAPLNSPQFTGIPTAPTASVGTSTGQLATTAFVAHAVTASTTGVASFNTRTGAVVLTTTDISATGGALLASPAFTGIPTAPTAGAGVATTQLATCAFVAAALAALPIGVASFNTRTGAVTLQAADVTAVGGALLASPAFSGAPTAPTPAPASNSTAIATTAYVTTALAALPAPVSSFNGRTGVVTFQSSDLSAVGGALLASPNFTGSPTAPTPIAGNNSTALATTAFVTQAVTGATAGVASFNTRTGAVTLQAADVTAVGGALTASPGLTGTPTTPTAAPGTNSTVIASTAFVTAAIAALTGGVTSFNSRTGAVTLSGADVSAAGGAMLSSPTFTGTPGGPTAAPGNNSTQFATTAFVNNAVASAGGVTTFNLRSGAVTLNLADIQNAGGAPLASPTFTGTPAGPTATVGTNSTQLASTAFVQASIAAISAGVTTFNTRSGAVTLQAADVTNAGGALLASPTFSGAPTAPTPAPADNSTKLATTAFVVNALATAGGVTTFNGRGGAVTLTGTDVTNAGGALIASPTFTGTPAAPTATAGTSTTQLATTAFVAAALAPFAPLASPAFTGTPTVPTAAPGTNTTQAASTAFVTAATTAAAALPLSYWSGTLLLTALGANASNVNNTTGVITFAAPHGISTGQFAIVTGTAPGGVSANTPYYIRALSATTLALYLLLADAKADANRVIPSTTGVAWSLRVCTYSNVVSKGFDPVCPIGAQAVTTTITPELNLTAALAGANALVLPGPVNNMARSSDGSNVNNWSFSSIPTVVSTTLIRCSQWMVAQIAVPSGGGAAVTTIGTWNQQGAANLSLSFLVIG